MSDYEIGSAISVTVPQKFMKYIDVGRDDTNIFNSLGDLMNAFTEVEGDCTINRTCYPNIRGTA